MGPTIKTIMRLASAIHDGDVFLTNDPYLGALHHNDVVIASPLWRAGRIVMWIANILHHPDSLFQEPPRYFLKIMERGELVREVEHTFVTNSRLPDMVALDLRAQLGAIHAAKQRLHALFDEYGEETITGVMRQSIDYAEQQVRRRIAELPDGTWSAQAFMDGDRVGSDRIHRVQVRLTKRGDTLAFDYEGSDPQVDAAVNCTYHACVAGTAVPLYTFLCGGEIDWNDGLLRCLQVHAPEGTVVNARFPAPVSICTIGFRWLVTVTAANAVAQLFAASPPHGDRACSSWIVSSNCNNLFGYTATGKRVGALLSDHRAGGAAARSFADGFSHAGQITSFSSNLGNVESTEWKLPVLYIFRRQMPDSGGPGQYRGGLTAIAAVIPYGVNELVLKSTNTAGTDQSNASGLCGGFPGAGSQVTVVRGSQVRALLRQGMSFGTYADFQGTVEYLPSKAEGILTADDVLLFYAPGGGGYGDPLERDPARVAEDVANGWVTPERAEQNYGVLLGVGRVDAAGTANLRARLRGRRAEGVVLPFTDTDQPLHAAGAAGDPPFPVSATLEVATVGGKRQLRCRRCGHAGTFRQRLLPLQAANPWVAVRWHGESPNFRLEERSCPDCGVLFAVNEVRIPAGDQ